MPKSAPVPRRPGRPRGPGKPMSEDGPHTVPVHLRINAKMENRLRRLVTIWTPRFKHTSLMRYCLDLGLEQMEEHTAKTGGPSWRRKKLAAASAED